MTGAAAKVPALGAALLALACSGCAGEREVLVRLPISRLELPEQGSRMLDIAIGGTGEAQALLTRDQGNVAPDPARPELSEDRDGLLRFDASPLPWVTISARGTSDLRGVQLKFLPLQGRGPVALALTVGLAGGDDRFDFNDGNVRAYTTTDSSLRDGALILGWRVDPTLMLYGGPWVSTLDYEGHHFSDRGGNPDVEFDYSGQLDARGVNFGLAASFRRWGRLLLEYSHARIDAGSTRDDLGHAALSLEIFFGPLLEHRPGEREEPPVEVVPAGDRPASGPTGD